VKVIGDFFASAFSLMETSIGSHRRLYPQDVRDPTDVQTAVDLGHGGDHLRGQVARDVW
jgi:hypothetical protein